MKKLKLNNLTYLFALLIIMGSYGDGHAQSKELLNTIDDIFKLSSAKNYTGLKNLCVTGNASEKSAGRLGKKINAFLNISDSYKVEGSQVNKKGKIEEHIVNVSFISGNRKIGAEFIFIKENNKFLLKDIN